ncbi:MAG: type II toxin-antitoxin system Phd/YefM family antitoxin [Anaerolineae bacterium]|nr:type II toxin-antitoxin system Phd/YefM family antitoxin [Anaerolineae bacterium]
MATRTISSTSAQNHFGQILDDVIQNRTRYVIKRRGVPQAVVLSLSDLEQLLADEQQRSQMVSVVRELGPVYDLGETLTV